MHRWCKSRVGLLCLTVLPLFSLSCAGKPQESEPPVPQTTEELQQAIADVLKETKTPGAGVVLVSKDEVLWTAGIGLADRATGRQVTPETMFRAGSISKSFVALALLKLQEEGKLQLDDRIHDLVGDIEFTNPWEETDPLRLVHLLEHTSGFNEISIREFAANVPAISHLDALAFDASVRTSRWRPGRFFSYSNANYALAGHVIERVSGRTFDPYLDEEILTPLQMKSASFLLTNTVRQNLATGYAEDGTTALPYEHILGRASGALNTTPGELAQLVQMLLNRGEYRGVRLLKPESIDRMETPTTAVTAQHGMRAGYGLGNYTMSYKGFRFHGHAGGMQNYLALYGYAPDHGVGYVFMINAANGQAMERIEKLILAYLTRDQSRPTPPSAELPDERLQAFTGYYEPHTPRIELIRFLDRLLGIRHVTRDNGTLQVRGLTSKPLTLVPAEGTALFGDEDDPAASIAFVEDEGEFFLLSGALRVGNYRRVPGWWVWGQAAVVGFCVAMMVSAVLFPLVWLPRKLLGRMKGVRHWSVRLLPLLAVLCLGAAFVLFFGAAASKPIDRLGHPTAWSVGFCVLTWLFAVMAVAGLVQAIRASRWEVNRWMWTHALLVSAANVVVLCYLAYWGVIGLRTWA
jgi:CubicO group peptidase (beta-lactamase class C family)